MVQGAPQVTELRTLTPDVAASMARALNGMSVGAINAGLRDGTYRMFSAIVRGKPSFAIVSRDGDTARIEALSGDGGLYLASKIIETARENGLRCDAWVLSPSLVRLVSRIGMKYTGEYNGSQLRVCA